MKAKKSLGQHFLHSEKALAQIIDAAHPSQEDVILEIGPGKGVLTEPLLTFAGKVVAIEKDRDMITILTDRFQEEITARHLTLIEQDILLFDPEYIRSYKGFNYKLVANIPYYITGAIIEKFLSASFQPQTMVLLMQKEVAERIIARDGKESVLSIAVKVYGTPRLVSKVPAGAFTPPPSVDSAILLVDSISRTFFEDCDESLFFKVLKGVFGKKRKQIGGSLSDIVGKEMAQHALAQATIDIKTRPEDMNREDWKKITIALMEKKNSVQ